MSDDCSPCSDEIKETCPDQDAATTSTCDVICDERYRSTPFLDKISTTGTRAPNGKCVYRLDGKPGFVVSDADGQYITLSPCNLLERLTNVSGDETDNFTFPFLVAVDEDGCMKQVMPPETGEYMLPFWTGTEFTWIEKSVLLDGCRNGMPFAPVAPLTGLGHLAFVTDTTGEYCVTMLGSDGAGAGGYVQVDAAGEVIIAALPPYPTAFTLPAVPPAPAVLTDYHLGLDALGNPVWDLKPVFTPTTTLSQANITPMPSVLMFSEASATVPYGNTVPEPAPAGAFGNQVNATGTWFPGHTYFTIPDGYRGCHIGTGSASTVVDLQLLVYDAQDEMGLNSRLARMIIRTPSNTAGSVPGSDNATDSFSFFIDPDYPFIQMFMHDHCTAIPLGTIGTHEGKITSVRLF